MNAFPFKMKLYLSKKGEFCVGGEKKPVASLSANSSEGAAALQLGNRNTAREGELLSKLQPFFFFSSSSSE